MTQLADSFSSSGTLAKPSCPDALHAYELPQLVRLRSDVVAACFPLMKLLVARHVIDHAIGTGQIRPGTRVLETTSGTFGLGLAQVCAMRGLPLTLVTDPVVDTSFRHKLEALGADIDIVEQPATEGGYQRSRLLRLEEHRCREPNAYVPEQYANPQNPAAYAVVADLIAERVGHVDYLVGCVGSGGSMCGISAGLRRRQDDLQVVGIDTHGSVLFGMTDQPRVLRGLGNSLMPPNVSHDAFTAVHWVNAAEAMTATQRLLRQEALFRGPTSGASFLVADWIKRQHPDASVVAVMADEGERYLNTVYNPKWRHEHGCSLKFLPTQPTGVPTPAHAQDLGTWSWMSWPRGRRQGSAA